MKDDKPTVFAVKGGAGCAASWSQQEATHPKPSI